MFSNLNVITYWPVWIRLISAEIDSTFCVIFAFDETFSIIGYLSAHVTAVVNKKSKNHVGCLMYNVFNVSIIKPADLPFDHWSGRHVEVNETISFKVVKVDISEVIPYIIGELEWVLWITELKFQKPQIAIMLQRTLYNFNSIVALTHRDFLFLRLQNWWFHWKR